QLPPQRFPLQAHPAQCGPDGLPLVPVPPGPIGGGPGGPIAPEIPAGPLLAPWAGDPAVPPKDSGLPPAAPPPGMVLPPPTPPAPGKPCEVAVAWLNRVQYAPDVVHDGTPTAGLVGRVYLFDQTEKYPVVGDGSVLITLFDDTKGPATQPLEQWYIDPVALKK